MLDWWLLGNQYPRHFPETLRPVFIPRLLCVSFSYNSTTTPTPTTTTLHGRVRELTKNRHASLRLQLESITWLHILSTCKTRVGAQLRQRVARLVILSALSLLVYV